MNQATLPAVLIRRRFDAPPARVYDAFANIKSFAELMRPEDVKLEESEADVGEGGEYKIVLRVAGDDLWTLHGTYREVSPPNRLALTWIWSEDDAKDEQHTLLTLEFASDGNGTELTLRHELFLREESRASHERGWGACLDKLTAQLPR
ncbi:MAG: SRPBCC domain-containing protein [Candidatus Baltobacteraceae bacterium]